MTRVLLATGTISALSIAYGVYLIWRVAKWRW